MPDDNKTAGIVPVVAAAAASAVDPTGGVLAALGSHVLTNMTVDAGWRGAVLDIWLEVLTEEGDDRRRQYKETKDEFKRHQMIWEWLQDELARVSDRVQDLEVVALGLMQRSEALLRKRSDPEMRPYLFNMWRNAVSRPDHFSGTWMDRCLGVLEKLGADHLKLLCALVPYGISPRSVDLGSSQELKKVLAAVPDGSLAWDELCGQRVTSRPDAGSTGCKIRLGPHTARLIELVSPPPQADRGPAKP